MGEEGALTVFEPGNYRNYRNKTEQFKTTNKDNNSLESAKKQNFDKI